VGVPASRGDVLQDESGSTLIPLLIFDQFEEIFTLAQSDDAGRARAARFIEDLADLVENRPPRELEARLETDEEAAGRFDFARSDYRVLIALRRRRCRCWSTAACCESKSGSTCVGSN
jgi:hypothetical protein